MSKILLAIILVFNTFYLAAFCQVRIQMTREDGVYTVPCKVNGLPLKFIFDTGASEISISLTEAKFMLKNGLLSKDDIMGSSYAQIANGDVIRNTKIILRVIEIGGLKLYNVKASVIHELEAPLLLGQSALEQLGGYQIVGSTLTILNRVDNTNQANSSDYTDNYSGVVRQKLKISSEGFFRDSPNSSGNVIFTIYQGTEIIGIRKNGDYWEAIYNNRRGYINDIYVDKMSSSLRVSEKQTYAYVDSEAFIRSEPNANSSTTVTVPGNSKVLINYKSQNGYWNVQYGYHTGFMNEVYMRFSK